MGGEDDLHEYTLAVVTFQLLQQYGSTYSPAICTFVRLHSPIFVAGYLVPVLDQLTETVLAVDNVAMGDTTYY